MTETTEERVADKIAEEMTEAQIGLFEDVYGEIETEEGQTKLERMSEMVESVDIEDEQTAITQKGSLLSQSMRGR